MSTFVQQGAEIRAGRSPIRRYTRVLGILGFIVLLATVLFGGAVISDFHGEPGHNKVTLYWKTLAETNVKGFRLERGTDDKRFSRLDFVKGKGNSTRTVEYKYEDKSVFKPTGRTFYYRIIIENLDGSTTTYPEIISVSPSVSSARQTWGSIKAMFR